MVFRKISSLKDTTVKLLAFILTFCLLQPTLVAQGKRSTGIQAKTPHFVQVHYEAVLCDTHNDILMRVLEGDNIEKRSGKGQSDMPRFREAGVDVQGFSIWVPPSYAEKGTSWDYATREIDTLTTIERRNSSAMKLVRNGSELETTLKAGRLSGIVAMEGAHPLENSIEKLIGFYERGLRILGLTWNNSTSWATSAQDENAGKQKGLTRFGKQIIRALDSLGVLIDVSHLGEQGFYDVLATSKNPIIASHSSCSSLREHYRNLKDEQIRKLAKSGGVMMINFFPAFIKSGMNETIQKKCVLVQKKLDRLLSGENRYSHASLVLRDKLIATARKQGLPTIHDVIAHIQHAVEVGGIDHVGFGSDFDGIPYGPVGLNSVLEYPFLTRELLRVGFNDEEVKKILGGNFVRVFELVCR